MAFLCVHYGGNSQTFTSKIVDSNTQKGIPYATVQYGTNEGVVTNDEGLFSFIIQEGVEKLDSIYISSMGYEKSGIAFKQAQDSIIYIAPKAIELSGVYLFDKELSVDEIIEKMKARLPFNYNKTPIKQRFFLRQSIYGRIKKVDFGFQKSSIKELNKSLIDSIALSIPKNSSYYTETLGDFYKTNTAYKMDIFKAAELYDKKNVGSFEDLGKRMEEIFKKNVKPDSYLKIKSGIFSQKVQVDSVLFESEEAAEVKAEADQLENELKKDSVSGLLNAQKGVFDDILTEAFYQEDSKLNIIDKSNRYEFSLAGFSEIDEAGVYVIDFNPKRNADYKGRMYINIQDFAVMRIDFENLNPLKKFRLLGLSYFENLYKGSMYFSKLPNDKYELRFVDFSFGRDFGVKRPLKVIEKNKNVKGRRKQNELSLEIDFQMNNTNKWELVIFENTLIDQKDFEQFKEDESTKAIYLNQYQADFWQGYNIMEPNQAIREFSVSEE
ncbi:MAG: carboxypeptidase-like regulatory domain-containing protein [Croceitalea sp.]|nr:carboxypeptidase-like regulatory domain-containing protein [Croceitalea sp.]